MSYYSPTRLTTVSTVLLGHRKTRSCQVHAQVRAMRVLSARLNGVEFIAEKVERREGEGGRVNVTLNSLLTIAREISQGSEKFRARILHIYLVEFVAIFFDYRRSITIKYKNVHKMCGNVFAFCSDFPRRERANAVTRNYFAHMHGNLCKSTVI